MRVAADFPCLDRKMDDKAGRIIQDTDIKIGIAGDLHNQPRFVGMFTDANICDLRSPKWGAAECKKKNDKHENAHGGGKPMKLRLQSQIKLAFADKKVFIAANVLTWEVKTVRTTQHLF